MLYESGLTNKANDTRKIVKPILDPLAEKWLVENNLQGYVKALTGVR
jgi:hypothetical protein